MWALLTDAINILGSSPIRYERALGFADSIESRAILSFLIKSRSGASPYKFSQVNSVLDEI